MTDLAKLQAALEAGDSDAALEARAGVRDRVRAMSGRGHAPWFADRPMNLGITRAGGRIHRLSDRDPLYSPCGQYLSRRFVKAPLEVSAPLCELCFEPQERHALVMAEMERS